VKRQTRRRLAWRERQAERRRRIAQGRIAVSVDIEPDGTEQLIALGLLAPESETDKRDIARAIRLLLLRHGVNVTTRQPPPAPVLESTPAASTTQAKGMR
jgi:hypothetical protein